MKATRSGATAICLMAVVGLAVAAQANTPWARFRGPNGAGIAKDAKPPVEWSESQNLKWKVQLPGAGTSSPILVGGRIFVTCWTGVGDGKPGGLKRHLVCLDEQSGKTLWSSSVPGESDVDAYTGFMQEHGYASQTPVSDGERVYVYFGKAGALAFDMDGRQLWQVNLGTGANAKNWGTASSPVLYKDTVIINASEESHAMYALDKKTGKEVWKSQAAALDYVFGTPVLAEHDGQTDLIVSVPNEVWGMNPDTGKLRWYAQSGLPGNIAPSVVVGDGVVYAFGGFPRTAAVAVTLGGKGDVTQTHVAWSGNTGSYIPTPVLHDGRLYFANDSFAVCLDAKTGREVYKERVPGAAASGRGGKPFYASPVLADGRIYVVSRRNGTFVLPAQPEFRVLAQNTFSSDDSQFNATPAFDGRMMFLRSDKYLYCIAGDAKP